MAIDSHMHINSVVTKDIENSIRDINKNNNLESVINIGLNVETSTEATFISRKNPKFYSTIGIHPLYTEDQNVDALYPLTEMDKIVAIGEIGLDSLKYNFIEQKRYFIKQILMANELHLPVVIHANNTNKKIIEIFETVVKPRYGCVFHCFQPDLEDLNYLVKHGYYISFAGRITYKNAKKSIEVAKMVPNDLILVETDSPYLSPEPYRGERNHSSNIAYIIKRIAEIKEMSYEEVENITRENTKRLYKKMK